MKNRLGKILLLNLKETLDAAFLRRLEKISKKMVFLPKESQNILSELKDTDCLLVNQGMTVDKQMIDSSPNLKYIGICATGYGRIDTQYATSKKISVFNVPGYATESVAEFVFAMLLEHLREIERAKQQTKKNIYSEAGFTGTQIKNKVFGVIGLGRIGQRVAEIASQGFKAKTIYWSRQKRTQLRGLIYKPLEKVIKESDIISLHLTINKETEKIINKKLINSIKPGTIFINTAPMELIDSKALRSRLNKGDITFILDHSDEMTSEDIKKLKKYKNCIIYPPIGFTTKEATLLKQEIFVKNVESFFKSKPINKVM